MLDQRRRMLLTAERELILYDAGDLCNAATGGWIQAPKSGNKGVLSFYSDSLRMFNSATLGYVDPRATIAITNNKILLRGFRKLCMTYHVMQRTSKSAIYIALYSSHSGGYRNYTAAKSAKVTAGTSGNTGDKRTVTLDISDYPGTYYIGAMWLMEADTSDDQIAYVHKVWLE